MYKKRVLLFFIVALCIATLFGCAKEEIRGDVVINGKNFFINQPLGSALDNCVVSANTVAGKSSAQIRVKDPDGNQYYIGLKNDGRKESNINDCTVVYVHVVKSELKNGIDVDMGTLQFASGFKLYVEELGLHSSLIENATLRCYYWDSNNGKPAVIAKVNNNTQNIVELIYGDEDVVCDMLDFKSPNEESLESGESFGAVYFNGIKVTLGAKGKTLDDSFTASSALTRTNLIPYEKEWIYISNEDSQALVCMYNNTAEKQMLSNCIISGIVALDTDASKNSAENIIDQRARRMDFNAVEIDEFGFKTPISELVEKWGDYENGPEGTYCWKRGSEKLYLQHNGESIKMIILGYEGIAIQRDYNASAFTDGVVMKTKHHSFKLNVKLGYLLETMHMSQDDSAKMVEPGAYETVTIFDYMDERHLHYSNQYTVIVKNTSKESQPASRCVISAIYITDLTSATKTDMMLAEGFNLYSTYDEIVDMLGKPDGKCDFIDNTYYLWSMDGHDVVIGFDNEEKVDQVRYCISNYYGTIFK